MILNELFLNEQSNEVAIIFGRFNPPHKGHRAAWEMASASPHWYVGTNKSTQGPKDPLPYDIKIQAMLTVWPKLKGHIVAEQSWLTMAAMVYEKHGSVTLLCCTDEEWVTKTIQQYNGVQGQHGYYEFTKVVQQPTPRLSSATALRAAVRAGDRNAFADAAGVPADTPVAGVPFFDLVDQYLSQYPEKVKEGWKGALAGAALAGAVGAGIMASPKIHVNGETYDQATVPAPADAKTVTVDGKTYKVWKKWHQGPKNPSREVRLYQRVDEAFDAAEFERHMAKLRAREELKKTNPMAALVGDLIDADNAKSVRKRSLDIDAGSNVAKDAYDPYNPYSANSIYKSVDEDASQHGHAPGEKKFRVQYDMYGSNRDVPLGTNTRTIWAKDEKEAITRLRKLVGGRNHKVVETIEKHGDKYRLVSKHGHKNLGTYDTKAGAEKRERQVQYFKHQKESTNEAAYPGNIGAMEMAKFFQVATPQQQAALKQALEQRDTKTVWDMLKSATGTKLHDVEFTEGLARGQAAWKKEMQTKGAVKFKRDQHGGGAVDRIVAYDKDGKVLGGFNRKVTEDAAGVGVIANKKQAKDPRYSMSLTQDVRPGEVDRNLRKLRLK